MTNHDRDKVSKREIIKSSQEKMSSIATFTFLYIFYKNTPWPDQQALKLNTWFKLDTTAKVLVYIGACLPRTTHLETV